METRTDRTTREELQALAKQEGQFGESVRATDKHGATKADVETVRSAIRVLKYDIRLLKYGLSIGLVLLLALFGDITLNDVLRLLLRLGGG